MVEHRAKKIDPVALAEAAGVSFFSEDEADEMVEYVTAFFDREAVFALDREPLHELKRSLQKARTALAKLQENRPLVDELAPALAEFEKKTEHALESYRDWSDLRQVLRDDVIRNVIEIWNTHRPKRADVDAAKARASAAVEENRRIARRANSSTEERSQAKAEMDRHRALFKKIRAAHRGSATTGYDKKKGDYQGPILDLMFKLFEQAGIPEKDWPSRLTLHNSTPSRGFLSSRPTSDGWKDVYEDPTPEGDEK